MADFSVEKIHIWQNLSGKNLDVADFLWERSGNGRFLVGKNWMWQIFNWEKLEFGQYGRKIWM